MVRPMSTRSVLAMATLGALAGIAAGGCFLWLEARDVANAEPIAHAPVPPEAQAALDAYAGHIEHEIGSGDTGKRSETWLDPATGRGRVLILRLRAPLTRPIEAVATVRVGDDEETSYVNYAEETFTSRRHPAWCPPPPANLAAERAQRIRDAIANGVFTISDHSTLRGRDVLEFRGAHSHAWVDPLTYLPLRTVVVYSSHDEYWLQRTPRNIAKTVLRVPAGFKRVRWDPGYALLSPACS